MTERTLVLVKPDGVQRSLIGNIIARFEQRGLKLVAIKLVAASPQLLKEHYAALKDKPFFNGLYTYMSSGPVCAMVWEGIYAVQLGRILIGETNPVASLPGTIRGDYAIDIGRNVCHGSDTVESAEREISLWFKEEELVLWRHHSEAWVKE